jgi:hypothetical protein
MMVALREENLTFYSRILGGELHFMRCVSCPTTLMLQLRILVNLGACVTLAPVYAVPPNVYRFETRFMDRVVDIVKSHRYAAKDKL